MNIHPIIVHFPVALLSLYSCIELLRFRRLTKKKDWFFLKAFVVMVGTLGAYVALATGEPAEHLYVQANPSMRDIVEIHSLWAGITATLYSILSIIYGVQTLRRRGYEHKIRTTPFVGFLWHIVARVVGVLNRPFVIVLLAFLGLCAVAITGSLGGFLVYGVEGAKTDPFIYFASQLVK